MGRTVDPKDARAIGFEQRKYDVVNSYWKVDVVARSWVYMCTYAHIDAKNAVKTLLGDSMGGGYREPPWSMLGRGLVELQDYGEVEGEGEEAKDSEQTKSAKRRTRRRRSAAEAANTAAAVHKA